MPEYPDLDKYKVEPDTTSDYPPGEDKEYKSIPKELTEVNNVMWKNMKEMKRIVEKKLLEDFCAAFKKKYYYHIVHQLTEQHYKDIVEEFLDERSKPSE